MSPHGTGRGTAADEQTAGAVLGSGATPQAVGPTRRHGALLWLLRILTAAGLAVGAYIHADLAPQFDPVTASISEGDLFRISAGAAAAAALLVLLGRRSITIWAFAFIVAAATFGALLLYHFVAVGQLGPLPAMDDPIWSTEKAVCAIAEGVATATALLGLAVLAASRLRRTGR